MRNALRIHSADCPCCEAPHPRDWLSRRTRAALRADPSYRYSATRERLKALAWIVCGLGFVFVLLMLAHAAGG